MNEVILWLSFFITMFVDGLNRTLTAYGWITDSNKRKIILFSASLLIGVLLSVGFPVLARNVFQDFYGVGDTLAGQVILGIALGFGSKAVYYLVDWVKLRRQSAKIELLNKGRDIITPP